MVVSLRVIEMSNDSIESIGGELQAVHRGEGE
jgi:hypothetical protein